ncbi:MAG: divalent metal cation transporter, partial [Bacteroidota bacterium]
RRGQIAVMFLIVMAAIVFLMGLAFIFVAVQMPIGTGDFLKNAFVPSLPEGSALLIIGLVGTTVVPYNLFLAGGLSKGQSMSEMRWGIALAVAIGGIISMAILLAGTQIQGQYSFPALAAALQKGLGEWAGVLFGFGLFAAGASSAVTAPLAAAMTGQGLLGGNGRWASKSLNFKLVWMLVLGVGLAFGLAGVRPIPVIIAAQAINGVLLPVVAIFLLAAVNDRRLLTGKFVNSLGWNLVMGVVVAIAAMLGIYNLWQAAS